MALLNFVSDAYSGRHDPARRKCASIRVPRKHAIELLSPCFALGCAAGLSKRQHAPGSERVLHDVHGIVMHPIDEIFVALTLPPPPLPSLVRGT